MVGVLAIMFTPFALVGADPSGRQLHAAYRGAVRLAQGRGAILTAADKTDSSVTVQIPKEWQ